MEAWLTYEWWSFDPRYPAQERLAVFPDGQAVLWRTKAANPAERNQAGTFALALQAERLEQARQIAQALAELPEDAQQGDFRGALQESLLAQMGDVRQGHTLNRSVLSPLPEALEPALALREALLVELRAAPLAVVELSATQIKTGRGPELSFRCGGLGSQAVEFLFSPECLSIWQRGPQGWQQVWQNSAEMTMGLLGPLGVLVDGLYSPATINPGAYGRVLLPLEAALPAPDPAESLWGRLEGAVLLCGPGHEEQLFPDTPFVLECALE